MERFSEIRRRRVMVVILIGFMSGRGSSRVVVEFICGSYFFFVGGYLFWLVFVVLRKCYY